MARSYKLADNGNAPGGDGPGSGDGQGGGFGRNNQDRPEATGGATVIEDEVEEEDPLPLPNPIVEGFEEDAQESQHLYLEFMREEFHRQGMDEQSSLLPVEDEMVQERLDWTRAGRDLRQIADAFSRSRERENVRRRARSIDVQNLDFESFVRLLQELFSGEGVTQERILVLFFFCADVSIEALRRGFSQSFNSLIRWSLKFIATKVAQWVHDHGGWGAVLRSSLAVAYQVTACVAFVAVAAACMVYIRRSLN